MLAVACFTPGASPHQAPYASESGGQTQAVSSQQAQSGSYLYAVQDSRTDLWGFADAAGKQVIPCRFASLGSLPGKSPELVTKYLPSNRTTEYFPNFGCS